MVVNIAISCIIVLLVNMLAFLLAFRYQTDKLTDITYSLSFIAIILYAYVATDQWVWIQSVLCLAVVLWAVRLGGYLFMRIHQMGVDHRFDEMRPKWQSFIKFWILQAVSVCIVASPVLIVLNKKYQLVDTLSYAVAWVGLLLIITGWVIEAVADYQKSKFKNDARTHDKFISQGLFSIVRFPNYLGEILFWIGIFMMSFPLLIGLEYMAVISPLWIIFLLTKVSGIPLLIAAQDRKYGHILAYQQYIANTKMLLPKIY